MFDKQKGCREQVTVSPKTVEMNFCKYDICYEHIDISVAPEEKEEVIVEDYSTGKQTSDNEADSSSSSDEESPESQLSNNKTESSKPGGPIKSALKSTPKVTGKRPSFPVKRPTSPPRGPVAGCPNTSNPFHECSIYCKEKYGKASQTSETVGGKVRKSVGFSEDTKDSDFPKPEDEIEDKLPLPPFWIKVIDPKR